MSETPKLGVGSSRDDESVSGEGSVIAILKRLRTLWTDATLFLGLTNTQLRATDVNIKINNTGVTVPVQGVAGGNALAVLASDNKYPYQVMPGAAVVIAPLANAVIIDTGPIPNPAGSMSSDLDIALAVLDTAALNKGMIIEHRNSTNLATLHVLGGCPAPGTVQIKLRFFPLGHNERIRVIAGAAAGAAASQYVASILQRQSPL